MPSAESSSITSRTPGSAHLILFILDGAAVATIPVAIGEFTKPVFDWRQLERWQVSEAALPAGSEICFRR